MGTGFGLDPQECAEGRLKDNREGPASDHTVEVGLGLDLDHHWSTLGTQFRDGRGDPSHPTVGLGLSPQCWGTQGPQFKDSTRDPALTRAVGVPPVDPALETDPPPGLCRVVFADHHLGPAEHATH